jgi:hypothetical protein
MLISLHKNATTTPATRLAIQQANGDLPPSAVPVIRQGSWG